MAEKETRLKETREDVFQDFFTNEQFSDPGMSFQQFNQEVSEQKEGVPLDDVGASLAAVNQFEGQGNRSQQTGVQTTTNDLYSARRFHEDRSEQEQARDEATDAQTVTGDFERWSESPGQLDFPGIDTTDRYGPTFED